MNVLLITMMFVFNGSELNYYQNGKYEVRKEYELVFLDTDYKIKFSKFKVKSNGKIKGGLTNLSRYDINYVWFDFDRYSKKGIHSKVSYSYPQLLFENLNANETQKVEGVSMVGTKWFKRFNFGPIISVKFESQYYFDWANKKNLPILLKMIETKTDKSVNKNKTYIEILNNTNNSIESISISLGPMNAKGRFKVGKQPVEINYNSQLKPGLTEILSTDVWHNETCVFIESLEIKMSDGKRLNFSKNEVLNYYFFPENRLYPTTNYQAIECLNTLNPSIEE